MTSPAAAAPTTPALNNRITPRIDARQSRGRVCASLYKEALVARETAYRAIGGAREEGSPAWCGNGSPTR
jgi:hypothetical protein